MSIETFKYIGSVHLLPTHIYHLRLNYMRWLCIYRMAMVGN
jgi:hypothetical protein